MDDAERVICGLRSQVRDLQSLLNYLESRDLVEQEDYAYLHTKLGEVIGRLKETRQCSAGRGGAGFLRAQWLN